MAHRIWFRMTIEHDGEWDSGTPFELLEELVKLMDEDVLFKGAVITKFCHTPYDDEPHVFLNTLTGEMM